MTPQLNQQFLDDGRVPDQVERPQYDRRGLTAGIVHIGVGGFHRAHQAVYLDDLMNAGLAHDWAICGVGVLPSDRVMADVLREQDGLFTVVTRRWVGEPTARVVGSLVEYLFAPDDPEAVVERMAGPEVRIVSLTVTEGGYDVGSDAGPTSTFGLITQALRRRRDRSIAPFAVVSCDNVEHNGSIARRAVTGFAAAHEAELAAWIDEQVAFPSSMVDRITPVTTVDDRAAFAAQYGFTDRWPVFCEPFTQWVLEDVLTADQRPPLEQVGVQLADDVEPYELMKLRLLNAGHQALGYLGALAGHEYVHEACADLQIAEFLRAYLREATPTLRPVPGIDLGDYRNELVVRFANPGIADRLERICAYSSDRMPKFVLPALAENAAAGNEVRCAALVVAAWRHYVLATGDALVDNSADRLRANAAEPRAFIADRALLGGLADDARFVDAYLDAEHALAEHGARAAAHEAALRSR